MKKMKKEYFFYLFFDNIYIALHIFSVTLLKCVLKLSLLIIFLERWLFNESNSHSLSHTGISRNQQCSISVISFSNEHSLDSNRKKLTIKQTAFFSRLVRCKYRIYIHTWVYFYHSFIRFPVLIPNIMNVTCAEQISANGFFNIFAKK